MLKLDLTRAEAGSLGLPEVRRFVLAEVERGLLKIEEYAQGPMEDDDMIVCERKLSLEHAAKFKG